MRPIDFLMILPQVSKTAFILLKILIFNNKILKIII